VVEKERQRVQEFKQTLDRVSQQRQRLA